MGDRLLTGYGQFDADELKLVTVSPFFVDAHEVTVAEYRTGGGTTGAKDLVAWSGALDGTRFEDWCTYTGTPGPHENYPLNCIVQRAARRFCQSRGGDLPTEAQFEYLEGGLQGQRFPWGSDVPDACDTAVWGRGGWPGFSATSAFSSSCRASDPATPREAQIGYPAPVDDPSQRKLDVIAIGPGLVQDIAGDLTEWTRDGFAPQDSPCWRGDRVLRDPDCPPTDEKAEMAIRGGSWLVLGVAAGRGSALPNEANLSIGFRCVYPAD
jgi:formylglycine-generating enzyme required for sulfatase activity